MKLVHDIENDIEHTIPRHQGPDTARLFNAILERTVALLEAGPGTVILDMASGMGQDSLLLAKQAQEGGWVVGTEPSNRMIRYGQEVARKQGGLQPHWVRALGEELPFKDHAFDAVLCKGAMDHFMRPELAMLEIARVLKPGGRAVIALANYDSLTCRLGVAGEWLKSLFIPGFKPPENPFYRPPPDHLVRFGYSSIRRLAVPPLRLARAEGLSLFWGYPPWTRLLWSRGVAGQNLMLNTAFRLGRLLPFWSDVVVIQLIRSR